VEGRAGRERTRVATRSARAGLAKAPAAAPTVSAALCTRNEPSVAHGDALQTHTLAVGLWRDACSWRALVARNPNLFRRTYELVC
jgi:hypothetical protein